MWLVGDLLVPGPPALGRAFVWEPPSPGHRDEAFDSTVRVLVVPRLAGTDDSHRFPGDFSRYAAVITGTAPPQWKAPAPRMAVVRLDSDLFRNGDRIRVEGATPRVELPDVTEVAVVTSFLEDPDGRILLLRRSKQVGTFQGRWAGVSGFLEAGTAEAQAYTEIQEETGLTPGALHLERAGRIIYARDGRRIFSVHPFRFSTRSVKIRLDWEHSEAEWVDPTELARRDVVPKLDRVWESVRPDGNP